jgi:tRNA A-37 threonylcarbamoyl transferase component Bud32
MIECILLLGSIGLLGALCLMMTRRARILDVNPRYRAFFQEHGLDTVEDYLKLPSVIVSGHPHRNVARVTIGRGREVIRAFLKREHRVPWKDYLASAWAGFGWVSRSYREAITLRALHGTRISCPEVLAAGEDNQGRAFLLVRELDDVLQLRTFLREGYLKRGPGRLTFARSLGERLADLHAAGFAHHDLYSTHILVQPETGAIAFVDWPRARRRHRLDGKQRWHDLASLHATLADDLATPRERLVCLKAYLRQSGARTRRELCVARRQVCLYGQRLLSKRYIRELRNTQLPLGEQTLVWLDGEALCATPAFHASLDGIVPTGLMPDARNRSGLDERVTLPGGSQGVLVRRRTVQVFAGLWASLSGRRLDSLELRRAAVLFRLQRYGVHTPRLLAFGRRQTAPWLLDSFLLTEAPGDDELLLDWLLKRASSSDAIRNILHEAGRVLRTLHDVGCYVGVGPTPLAVRSGEVHVTSIHALQLRRRPKRKEAEADLRHVLALLSRPADVLRLLRGYRGERRLTPEAKRWARTIAMTWNPTRRSA